MSCSLFTDAELFDKRAITGKVSAAQVLQQAFTTAYHLHQPALAGEIFFIGLKVV